MTKEKYMALADFNTVWTNSIKPWIVAGFIAVTAVSQGATPKLVLQDGTLLDQSTFQPAGSYVLASEKGANSGVATLGADGKVPASQLPSFVDDVIEAANFAALPAEGEAGKIYVTLDNNKTYRWGGTTYVEISAGLALGETQGTAYEGSKGKANADAIAAHTGNSDIHVTTSNKTTWNAKYSKPSGGIPKSDLASAVQTSLGKADTALQSSDITGKADKVSGATANNFAGLDANGNLKDSGKKAADFATAAQGTKADSAIQSVKVNGTALTPDANKAVNVTFEIPERVTSEELATFVV
jgi:hypothetical protein